MPQLVGFGFLNPNQLAVCESNLKKDCTVERLRHQSAAHMTSLDYYAIEDLLTDDERAARDWARRFVQDEVMPEVVPCHRAGKFPEHLTARLGALGLLLRI